MARVSIYVSDELKARMDEARDALNWSDIARPAFETALATYNHRKGPTMQTAIERLRASKAQYTQEQEVDGKTVGRDWASLHAEYGELSRLSQIDSNTYGSSFGAVWQAIKKAIDPHDNQDHREVQEHLFGNSDDLTEEWLAAWLEGAQELFAEVEDQLDGEGPSTLSPDERAEEQLRKLKRTQTWSWVLLYNGCLDLLGRPVEHSSAGIRNLSRRFARQAGEVTGKDLEWILAFAERNRRPEHGASH